MGAPPGDSLRRNHQLPNEVPNPSRHGQPRSGHAGAVVHEFAVPEEEPDQYRIHREQGGAAPPAGAAGTVYARFPAGPSSDELSAATANYLKVKCPEALASMLESKFNALGWKVIWTPPYWPKCQPIENVWGGGKQRAAHMYMAGRTLTVTREHLRLGFYGGPNHEGTVWGPIDVAGCVRHAELAINHWISMDLANQADGLEGDLSDLRGIEKWTSSDARCLSIEDMGLTPDEEADDDALDGGDAEDLHFDSDSESSDEGD